MKKYFTFFVDGYIIDNDESVKLSNITKEIGIMKKKDVEALQQILETLLEHFKDCAALLETLIKAVEKSK